MLKLPYPMTTDELKIKYLSVYCMFEDIDCITWNKSMINLIFFIRRLAISFLIVFTNGIIQLTVGILFCLIVRFIQSIFHLIFVKPYSTNIQNYNRAMNEILLLIFYLVEILNQLTLYTFSLEDLATFSIRIVLATMCYNTLINTYYASKLIIKKVKGCFEKKNVEVLPVNKITLGANTGKLFDE